MKCKSLRLLVVILMVVMFFAGCASKTSNTIKIATKPMTEQLILGEMLGLLIEQETGCEVEITKGIGGGTSNIHPAIVKGDFDLYPEYTATGWLSVLKKVQIPEDNIILTELQKEYSKQYQLTWVGQYGFNNTYAVAVRDEVAEKYGLKTCSDLAKVSDQLVFGGNGDFIERVDGLGALCKAYNYNFKKTVDIDMGLKYKALETGEIDVTNAFTTDAQLNVANVTVLEDDKSYFTNYLASTVVREDSLGKYPGLKDAIMEMDNILSDSEMVKLNYAVEVEERDEKDVAKEFLLERGILK